MKVSRSWLQTYFDTPLPEAKKLGELLTFHAFEIEEVIPVGDDFVIDVKVTPNRGHDCLCHRGIAKELSVILNQPLKSDPLQHSNVLQNVGMSANLEVEITDSKLCKRFTAAEIKNTKVGPSPDWLKKSLETIGQRSINNVVDATNYVMFNLGQPLHAFDADKLADKDGNKKIIVRTAKAGESFTALDNKQYTPTGKDLFITDGNSGALLGIAGVKGGKQAEVDSKTINLIIEAANFDRTSIRKTSKRHKLRTDASQRFENEISPELTAYGLKAVTDLIIDIAGGELVGFVDVYPERQKQEDVSVSVKDINGLLGTSVGAEEITDIFTRFGFKFKTEDDTFIVTPPFERLDLVIKEDLIEEVGRIYGYEKIKPVTPSLQKPAGINKRFFYSEKIRNFLIHKGFSEVYTSSFRNAGDVELANAVASDKNFLRQNLTLNLKDALSLNKNNAPLLGLSAINIFEIGTVVEGEREIYALAFGSWVGEGGKKEAAAKTFVEETKAELEKLLGTAITGTQSDSIFETDLGKTFADLSDPSGYENLEIQSGDFSYKPFSAYPFALRDIALWASSGTSKEEIAEVIKSSAGNLLTRLDHFDSFEKDGKVSHAFHLVFQSYGKTLSDEEMNGFMDKVNKAVGEKGWEVR